MSRYRLVSAGMIAMAALALLGWIIAQGGMGSLLLSLRRMGPWGPVVLGAAYVPACVLLLPGWPLSLGAGFLFGVTTGTLAVSLGSTVGATAAFAVARYALRDDLRAQIQQNVRFRALDRVIAQRGPQVVLLARLSPVLPFNVLNYALGLTSVTGRAYVGASWLGMLPGTVAYVYAGATVRDLAEVLSGEARQGVGGLPLLGLGMVATAGLLWLLVRGARRNLADILKEEASEPGQDQGARAARLGEKRGKL